MTKLTEMKTRVATKGIQGKDIKVHGLLSKEQIASISEQNVFNWIATKVWDWKDFQKWLNAAAPFED